MAISAKIHGFMSQSSWIRKMFEEGISLKKQFGPENVFDFSLGNPNVRPPGLFKEKLQAVAGQDIPGMHGYMPNAGYPDTRAAVAAHLASSQRRAGSYSRSCYHDLRSRGGLECHSEDAARFRDEVVIPTPFFVEYRFYVDNAGGVTRSVKSHTDFSLDLEAMAAAVTEKTKVVLINSPNNPTGKVYDEASIKGLATLLTNKSAKYGREIYLVSDEPYSDIVYDGVKVPSVLASYRNSIIDTSYSKNLSLPGERIGYIAVNPQIEQINDVLNGLVLCNRILGFVNAPAIMQRVVALLQGVQVNVEEYKRKRDLLCDGLASLGYVFDKPEGAFYLFPRTPIEDDVEFVKALQKRRILTVPGSGFGGPGHFRIAYCVDDRTIINAMDGFKNTIKDYR